MRRPGQWGPAVARLAAALVAVAILPFSSILALDPSRERERRRAGDLRAVVRHTLGETAGGLSGAVDPEGDLAEEDQILAAIPEPRHGKIRRIVNSVFAYHHARAVEEWARALATGLMQTALVRSRADGHVCLMQAFARPLPSAVIAHLLGIPAEDHETFARWSDETLALQSQTDAPERPLRDIHAEFSDYLREQVEQRRDAADPPDDLTTRLLCAELDGERLSERAVRTQLTFLIMAGNETTRNLIGSVFRRLTESPELFASVAADAVRIDAVIEETLRIDSPVQLLARTCTRAIELDGTPIAPGERVLFSVASANRDAARFERPDEFDLSRPRPRDHLAFGAGPHVCPGAFLARLETRIAIETLVAQVGALAYAPSHVPDQNPVFWANGPQRLDVVLQPRA